MNEYRLLLSSEVRELAREVARLLDELDRAPRPRRAPPGECSPALDVIETDSAVEIVMDVPGVSSDDVRILIKRDTVLIVGEKCAPDPGERAEASFHLVERAFGRFARAVRVTGAFDGARARARLNGGELRLLVPKIEDRRGLEIHVPIEQGEPA